MQMKDHMTAPLSELKAQILEDGIVDAQEVAQMKERLYADGVIDREEADFLFAINDAVSGKDNDASWQTLFVEAITAHVLEDEESPGEIDEDEAAWLVQNIQADGQVDAIEKALIENILAKAKSVPDSVRNLI
jgi:hypothetical protein